MGKKAFMKYKKRKVKERNYDDFPQMGKRNPNSG